MSIFSIEIPVDLLKAAHACVSTEETRYYLNGVFVDPRGWLVATDGHRLFAARISGIEGTLPPEGVIIPRDTIKKALTGYKQQTITLTDKALGDTLCTFIDGTFPAWERVVPKETSSQTAQFNPAYVGDMGKIAKLVGANNGYPHIWHNGEGPALVSFFPREDCFAVLMPVRSAVSSHEWPFAALQLPTEPLVK